MWRKLSDSLKCVCLIIGGEVGCLEVELVSGTEVAVDITSESVWNGLVVGTAVVGTRGVVVEGLVMMGAGSRI